MEALEVNITETCPLPFSGITGRLFLNAVTSIIATHCTILDDYSWPPDHSQNILEDDHALYDFVIVGAGTAGSLIASHLTKLYPFWKILLIEAGDVPGIDSEIPAFLFLNQNSTNDWFYKVHPDGNSCLGFQNNSCIWSKGKGLGGSSSINAMIYLRGHPMDYSEWEELGNVGWNYDELLAYFNEQEYIFNITDTDFPGYDNDWYNIIDDAWTELGYTSYKYKNHEALIGTKRARLLTKNGKRMNTAKVYFMSAGNIKIMKNTLVEKILINANEKKAIGVKITKGNISKDIYATKEVILSAGSIATPQILMLSGIGPASQLKEIGIECLKDLPVGHNLQDHIILPLFLKTNKHSIVPQEIINILLAQYMLTKSGPFSTIGITDYMGFMDTTNNSVFPDIQFHYTHFAKQDNFVLKPYLEGIGYKSEIVNLIQSLNQKHDILGIYPTLLRPKSRGEVHLDKPLLSEPIINANYFQHPEDIRTFIKAINFVHNLEGTSAFKEREIELVRIDIAECMEHLFDTEDYWTCYMKHMATTIYHPVGTTKMGPQTDVTSVVSSELLVHGLKNLRIVDASIMPTIPRANTMAATLVIAQKAVDIIKKVYQLKDEL